MLNAAGEISESFRWADTDCEDDPVAMLVEEGVGFSVAGKADPSQRLHLEELARLAAIDD